MNAKLAKEERANLKRAMGETATLAFEGCQKEVADLHQAHRSLLHQHAAIAKELAELKAGVTSHAATLVNESRRLSGRIDGVASWCEQNEALAKGVDIAVSALIPLLQIDGAFWGVASVREDCHRLTMALLETTSQAAERFNSVIHGSLWVRLMWALFGTVPYCVERDRRFASVDGQATQAQGNSSVAPSQAVIE